MRSANGLFCLHGDHLGSTSVTSTASGASYSTQLYYPFGSVRYTTGRPQTDYTFTGQRDDRNGLLFYNARYYDSALGRFIQADTLVSQPGNPQDLNRYTYARNNPLKYVDPSGRVVWLS